MQSSLKISDPPLPFLWRVVLWTSTILTVLAAAYYLLGQTGLNGKIDDPFFVMALLVNTLVTSVFATRLFAQAKILFNLFPATPHQSTAACQIFGAPINVVISIGFASIIAGAVYVLSAWDQNALNIRLSLFLFFANIPIGMGIGALVQFWILSRKSIEQLDIQILNLTRPDIVQFLNVVSYTVILAGLLSSIAVLSLLGSKFALGIAIVAFSLFAFSTVIGCYIIPLFPLATRIRAAKLTELNRVEMQISDCYHAKINGQTPPTDVAILLTYRDAIRGIHTLPPNGQFSTVTAATATFLSFLPTLVSHFLNLNG